MKKPTTGHVRLPDRNKVKVLYEQQLAAYKAALQQLAQDMRLVLEQQGLTPAIRYRVKSFDAYYDKLRKHNTASINRRIMPISDFFGLRIVCPFLEGIETVSSLIAANFNVMEKEHKANQHSFREFGYDSVHLAIRFDTQQAGRLLPGVRKTCEIQLRTILQEAWAEVEHELVYKSDISLPNQSIRRKLASLNATLTLSDLIFQEIRDYQKEIRQHGRKRRAMAEQEAQGQDAQGQKARDQDLIAISHPTTTSSSAAQARFLQPWPVIWKKPCCAPWNLTAIMTWKMLLPFMVNCLACASTAKCAGSSTTIVAWHILPWVVISGRSRIFPVRSVMTPKMIGVMPIVASAIAF